MTETHELLREVLRKLDHIQKEIETMAKVQLSVGFSVAPGTAGNPLIVTPPTATVDLTAGVAADGKVVATASGGTPPYSLVLDPTSGPVPPGVTMAIDPKSGVVMLSGTPTTASGSIEQVLADISDSAVAPAAAATATTTGAPAAPFVVK
jgi:hypothetical protein